MSLTSKYACVSLFLSLPPPTPTFVRAHTHTPALFARQRLREFDTVGLSYPTNNCYTCERIS